MVHGKELKSLFMPSFNLWVSDLTAVFVAAIGAFRTPCISFSDKKKGSVRFESQTLRCRDHPGFPFLNLSRSGIGSKLCVLKIWNPIDTEAATESWLLGDNRIKQLARYQLMMAQVSQNIGSERWLTTKGVI